MVIVDRVPRKGGSGRLDFWPRSLSDKLLQRLGHEGFSVTDSVTNSFLRDGDYVTDPVVKDSNATYTPGISERRSGTTKLLSHNLKSADSQTTTGQSIAASRVYDAFGNVVSSTGTFLGPFGYGGGFGYWTAPFFFLIEKSRVPPSFCLVMP